MSELISVIIPVYNHEKELTKALNSVFAQSYKNIEVIVIDDGSSEDQKIKKSKNQKYKLVRQENRGAPSARNRGLEMAKGEYVIFWDADVIAKPEMLAKMQKALQDNLGASFAYSNFYFGSKKMSSKHFNIQTLKQNNYIHSTSLIRREDAVKWDESLKRFQDWDYWLSLAEQGKTGVWVDEFLFKVLPGGTMSKWLPKFAYKKPWKFLPGVRGRVEKYEGTQKIVLTKDGLR